MNGRSLLASSPILALAAFAIPALGQEPVATKKVDVTPYLGIDQVLMVPLKGEGDVLTYTNLTAGVTVEVQTQRVDASANLQYTHSFGWGSALDSDVLSGVAQAGVKVTRGLTLQAGGIASRVRTDGYSGAATIGTEYTSQVWAGYIGPTYTTRLGDFDVRGAYRLGYARVDDDVELNAPGAVNNGGFSDSWSQSLNGSIGFAPGTVLPVGLTASAGYDREDASQLDQRFEDVWGRLDATLPVSPTVALLGGVGYEDIEISQRSPLLDANGNPVIDNGRYVTDKSSPRELYYDSDGLIWDVGVLWRPNRRTSLQATVGERYGGMSYQGSFIWQGRNSSFGLVVFDGIDSFGRMITSDAAALNGSNLIVPRNPFTGDITGCAFSPTGGGQCFNDALTGITAANFRYRGVGAQYSSRHGPWGWGLGTGYSQRKFITPEGQTVIVSGTKDQNWYGNGTITYAFNDRDSLDTAVYINYFDASNGRPDVLNYGAFSSYFKGLTRRLTASASVGLDAVKADDFDTLINAMGQVGLRYSF
ncbi:hypothetical protein PMI04_013650 [Sphingobium sp. AP49]|uniref:hypothetical protein n=1 Tax=Sphingobium sp. AP49 TaxID=1144307 RepID=UPI00026EE4FF|nr:hypothetical protein [Sphingobium sp. AP49]WHO37607.1 hypothetical protein PMI04_013650 [Sphingobium sp. AP49]